ncbi:MAG TPA: histidine kinase N-terminal domain-containing protein, partial [Acidimicrobiales bacterium]
MATLAELADLRTSLTNPVVDHLLRLTASWSLLADLSFSDMLLMARVDGPDDDSGFVVLGQMRPNNRSTMINDDLVGTTHDATSWPLVHLAFESGTRIIGEVNVEAIDEV